MAEVTQADVDAEIEKLNNNIQQKRGLPPIQAVPDVIAQPPATQADLDAALEKLNADVDAKKGAVALPPKEAPPEQPARPNPLEYIAKSALTAGANLGAGLMSGQPEAIEGAIPFFNGPAITPATPETTNKMVFGGNGQVIPPDQYSKYAGAAVGSLATNPLALLSPINTLGGAVGAGLGGQGGADLSGYLPEGLRPYASFLGGVVGGGIGGAAQMRFFPPGPEAARLSGPYAPKTPEVENALRAKYPDSFTAKDEAARGRLTNQIDRTIDDQPTRGGTFYPGGQGSGQQPVTQFRNRGGFKFDATQMAGMNALNDELRDVMGAGQFDPNAFSRAYDGIKTARADPQALNHGSLRLIPDKVMEALDGIHEGIQAQNAARAVPAANIDWENVGKGPILHGIETLNQMMGQHVAGPSLYALTHIGSMLTALGTGQTLPLVGNAAMAGAQLIGKGAKTYNARKNFNTKNKLLSDYGGTPLAE